LYEEVEDTWRQHSQFPTLIRTHFMMQVGLQSEQMWPMNIILQVLPWVKEHGIYGCYVSHNYIHCHLMALDYA